MFVKLAILICAFQAAASEFSFPLSRLNWDEILRVIGGENAAEKQFPYQASLQLGKTVESATHICGGVIIDTHVVLTAAHCFITIKQQHWEEFVFVKAGLTTLAERGPHVQIRHPSNITTHEKYQDNIGPYDIAVMLFDEPFIFTEYVQPAVLPPANKIHTGMAIVSGWGSIYPAGRDQPLHLQYAELPLLDYKTCKYVVDIYPLNALDTKNICSGPLDGGKGICRGDSGGPLVQKTSEGKNELIGLMSWGPESCGSKYGPGVYTRVSAYVDYINQFLPKQIVDQNVHNDAM